MGEVIDAPREPGHRQTSGERLRRRARRGALSSAATLMDAVSKTLRRVPPLLRYLPADMVTLPLTTVPSRRRHVIEQNFATMLGLPIDDPKVSTLARASVRNYGRMAIDFLSVRTMNDSAVLQWVDAIGYEYLDDALALKRGVILALPHLGSWDVAAVYAGAIGCKLTVVVESDWMAELVSDSRRGAGVTLVTRERTLRTLFRTLERNDCVAMLADLADGGLQTVEVPFFGRPTPFPAGPARISHHTGAPILVIGSTRLPNRRYRIEALPPIYPDRAQPAADALIEIASAIAAGFERFVARYPSQWYPFHAIWTE